MDDYDLIITDLSMPNMNGIDFFNKIREIRNDIPVFICTGNTDPDTIQTIKEAGIKTILEKPVDIMKMARIIKNIFK